MQKKSKKKRDKDKNRMQKEKKKINQEKNRENCQQSIRGTQKLMSFNGSHGRYTEKMTRERKIGKKEKKSWRKQKR